MCAAANAMLDSATTRKIRSRDDSTKEAKSARLANARITIAHTASSARYQSATSASGHSCRKRNAR
jgi:hypothetical protein